MQKETQMHPLIVVLIVLLLLGGGGSLYANRLDISDVLGVLLIILMVMLSTGRLR